MTSRKNNSPLLDKYVSVLDRVGYLGVSGFLKTAAPSGQPLLGSANATPNWLQLSKGSAWLTIIAIETTLLR